MDLRSHINQHKPPIATHSGWGQKVSSIWIQLHCKYHTSKLLASQEIPADLDSFNYDLNVFSLLTKIGRYFGGQVDILKDILVAE